MSAQDLDTISRMGRLFCDLHGDELLVIECIARRMVDGRKQYGELILKKDGRSFDKEIAEEVFDCMAYLGMKLVKERGR